MNEPAAKPLAQPDSELPATATADEELLAALADDFAACLRRGEHPSVEEYVAKHPALAERIRNVLSAAAMMEQTRAFHSAPADEGPGSVIGRYKLLERIGEGGFGVVYMAEQQQPVRRKVALKVVKPGMDSRQVLARFEAERQALAIMDHENIARVLDAGATETGRPYFVMELVKGVPITDYCDQCNLSTRERLELFITVCQAVQHAHQKGVIHRDIKPDNVLVAMQDGRPAPKIIDFGVAKALNQRLTEQTLATGFAQMIGTPLYLSPEQAELSPLGADTRSDIYSLGVLLYELLTGTTPFDKDRLYAAGYDELRRIIREEEPPKPSARLSTLRADLASTVAEQRRTEPRRLAQQVRGELDWIVMKCLEKDRNRRYESASTLARDIERFLRDEPVQACPPSAGYRLRTFMRRHQAAFVIASIVTVAALLVVGSLGWMVRDRTAREQEIARDQATRQALLNARIVLALDEAMQRQQEGRWREALDAAKRAEALVTTGGSDNSTRQRVGEVLGDMQMLANLEDIRVRSTKNQAGFDLQLEDSEHARLFKEYGIDIDALDRDAAATRIGASSIRYELAVLLDSWSSVRRRLVQAGSKQTSKDWKEILEIARQADPDLWRDQFRRAVLSDDRQALVELAATAPIASLPARTVDRLGDALIAAGAFREAAFFLKKGQRLHPQDYWINLNLGKCLSQLGPQHLDEALCYYTAAAALRPETSLSYTNLGITLAAQGNWDDAIACYRRAIELNPKASWNHYKLAEALDSQGKPEEATRAHRQALGIHVAALREAARRKPHDPVAHYKLAAALREQRNFDESIAACKEALRLKPALATDILNHVAWYFVASTDPKFRDPKRAAELANLVLAEGPSPEQVAICAPMLLLADEADAYRRLCAGLIEEFEDTKELRTAYLVARVGALGPDAVADPTKPVQLADVAVRGNPVGHYQHALGLAYYRAGQFDEAINELHKSIDSNWNANAANWLALAMAHARLDQVDEARKWFDKAVRWIDYTDGKALGDSVGPLQSLHRHDSLACLVLRREAERLLGAVSPPEATKDAGQQN